MIWFDPLSKRYSLPPLNAARVFEAAARHESFRLAADELSITQSAVSHQIAHLETHLGKALFRRIGRKVELTEAGQTYFPFLQAAFEKIDSGTKLVVQPQEKEITVQIYVTLAARWMMPRLHRLQKECPDIRVRFNASLMDWEFDPASADVGIISTATPNRQGFDYIPLFKARLIAVCHPDLFGPQETPVVSDVLGHTLLQVYTAKSDWEVWLKAAGVAAPPDAATIRFDSYLLALEAALDGQGIAVVPDFLAEPDLRSNRLVQPVPFSVEQLSKWYLVALSGRMDEAPLSRLRDWLLSEINSDNKDKERP